MRITSVTPNFAVTGQIAPEDLDAIAAHGFRTIINNRPDGEAPDQPKSADLAARAAALGLRFVALPVVSGRMIRAEAERLRGIMDKADGPVLAFCRSGSRSRALFEAAQQGGKTAEAGTVDVLVIGGGAAGLATAASILRRRRGLSITVVEPSEQHYYQPGWTMVGAGVFKAAETRRAEARLIPAGVEWLKGHVASFDPDRRAVVLEDGTRLGYRQLVVAAGLTLDWGAIDGLEASLGRNGVTSNYRYDTAPYTWQLVQELREGVALFTQPPMPIKCAGAPQKAMYLSCDQWRSTGRLERIDVAFHNAGAALFGVPAYVPELMRYVERYGIDLRLGSRLVAVDGPGRTATFADAEGALSERHFDMLHVCPPQRAPAFIANSPLADSAGWVAVDPETLRHPLYPDVFGVGDCAGTTNAKTAAAARKQAPVVAANVVAALDGNAPVARYDGYGSCPLTVERGRIVLAEFGYAGRLLPSFPKWLIDGERAQRLPWLLKRRGLPLLYWNAMLKGREWLAAPAPIDRAA